MPPTVLLSCDAISKSYGTKSLFAELSLALSEQDHVGMLGPNGSGKSTLLKILAGLETPDQGTRSMRRHLRLGYVPQEPSFPDEHTVEDILIQGLVAEGGDPHEQGRRVSKALSIGEFPEPEQSVDTLSGGWKKRLAIVRALLLEPEVLLLDEPTNHLDLEGILWLESLLKHETRAFLVVSHDRRFLDAVASRMLELNRAYPNGVFEAHGRYSQFLEQREAALSAQATSHASLANRVRREVEWLRRGPKARTTKAKARVDSAGQLMDALHDLESRQEKGTAGIEFAGSGRRSKQLMETKGVGKSFGGHQIVRDLDLHLGPGQRLGLLGPNGSGKTTVLKLLAGSLEPDQGTITRADQLRIVTFEQHRESLDQEVTLRRALAPDGDAVMYQNRSIHLVSWAKRFLFQPEQLDLPVSRLSGGEQARVLLARLMLQPADVLILDEPTNDLDIPTLEVLEDSLVEFPGALILVTHDRWLLDRVSTLLLALDGGGRAEWFADYAQWEAAQQRRRARPASVGRSRPTPEMAAAALPAKRKGLTYREQQDWQTMEQHIAEAEAAMTVCEAAVNDPSVACDADALRHRCAALEAAHAEVDRLYIRWAELEAKRAPSVSSGRP